MYYDWNAGTDPYMRDSLPMGEIYDANGLQLQHVMACDTETGWVLHAVCENGQFVVNQETEDVATIEEYHAAPLLVKLDRKRHEKFLADWKELAGVDLEFAEKKRQSSGGEPE